MDQKFSLIKDQELKLLKSSMKVEQLPSGREDEGGVWYYSESSITVNFYNLKFATDLSDINVTIKFDIDDGFERDL
jgi:hypothetical protein